MTDATSSPWDAVGVVAQAKAMIQSSNYEKVADARKGVDETLASWVAALARQRDDDPMAATGRAAVVALWRQYAALEMELRQFKQATKVLERAVSCPIAATSTALWLQYADFCIQRNKFSNARKVFVRALATVPPRDQTAVWARFYGFVCTHVDKTLSLAMLQHQVMPDKFPRPSTTITSCSRRPVPASAPPPPPPPAPVSSASLPAPVTDVPSSGTHDADVALVDPVVAFIDKTGEVATPATSPLAVDSLGSSSTSMPCPPTTGAKKQDVVDPSAYFTQLPLTLPFIPSCPHLLFDSVAETEAQQQHQIDTKLLERLSDVLSDCAVFEGVRDLRDNQRTRDREMLYRWQELVGMQMKEGSELFARHVALELQHGFSDPRGLIALKTQHLEQRREFSSRCLMSQHQFLDICAMDRANALKAQQISMENMKIPEMTVTTDADKIQSQRAIVGLILEAEKLWQEENHRTAATTAASAASACTRNKKNVETSSLSSPGRAPLRQRRDSQDSNTSASRSSNGGGGGRNGPSRPSRNWTGPGNPPRRRERDPRAGPPRSKKWDIQPPAASGPSPGSTAHSQPPCARYEYAGAPPRAPEHHQPQPQPQQMARYDRGPQRLQLPLQQPPQQQQPPRHFQHQHQSYPFEPQYGQVAEYAGPAAYFPDDACDRFGGPSRGPPAATAGWPPQPQFHHQQPRPGPSSSSSSSSPYDPSLSRYGAGGSAPSGREGIIPYGSSGGMPPPLDAASYYPDPSSYQPPPRDSYSAPYNMQEPPPAQYSGGHHHHHSMGSSFPPPQYQTDHLLPSPSVSNNRRNRRGGRYRR